MNHTPGDDPVRPPENDHLWSGEGPPDPDVERLERTLGAVQYRGAAPALPEPRRVRVGWPAIAASIALIAGAAVLLNRLGAAAPPSWGVHTIAGTATIDARPLDASGSLRVGEWLETSTDTRVRVEVADIGDVTVHPESRLRVLATETGREHRVELARGGIDAFIYAPPRLFFVDTPVATAVDLGCAYTLEVDERGAGRLEVTLGWVMLEGVADSTVPAGARCVIDAEHGPGTPVFADATPRLKAALDRLDTGADPDPELDVILADARIRDCLTLWHLLARVPETPRQRVLDRMLALAPPPARVDIDRVMSLERDDLERWWTDLEHDW
jgi:hypothetical protein